MADIRNTGEPNQAELTVSLDELRVLVHRLAPEDSFLRQRAKDLIPEEHDRIAEALSETLRRFHDREMNRIG